MPELFLKSATRSYKKALRARVAAAKIYANEVALYNSHIKGRHAERLDAYEIEDATRNESFLHAARDLVLADGELLDAQKNLRFLLGRPVLEENVPESPSYSPTPDSPPPPSPSYSPSVQGSPSNSDSEL